MYISFRIQFHQSSFSLHTFFFMFSHFSGSVNYCKINLYPGGVMKRAIVSVAALLSLALAAPAFAAEETQPSAGTTQPSTGAGANFEQRKADHLKKLDDRINSLQGEKTCVQSAKNSDELRACRMKHKSWMKDRRNGMGKRGGRGSPDGSMPPQVK
jgi:hypothetical protein